MINIGDFLVALRPYGHSVGMELYKDPRYKTRYSLNWIVFLLSSFNLITTIILEVVYLIVVGRSSNYLEMTALAPCTGFCIISAVKLMTFTMRKRDIVKFFKILYEVYPKTEKDQEVANIAEHLRKLKRVQRICLFQATLAIWVFSLAPMALSAYEYLKGSVFQMRYSFLLWYPFAVDTYAVYWSVIVQQWHAGHIAAIVEVLVDVLLYSMIYMVCMQFEHIATQISFIRPNGSDEDPKKMMLIIRQHQIALELSRLLSAIFSIVILSNFLITTFIICLVLFETTVVGISDLIKYLLFLVFELIQIFATCYYSDLLITTSNKVGDAAFNSDWLSGNQQYRRMILFTILRAQKPAVMTAQGFSIVSLKSFTNVMSTSYQFFALLRKFYNK